MNDENFYHELFPEGIYIIPEHKTAEASDSVDIRLESESPHPEVAENQTPVYKGENMKGVLVLHDGELPVDQQEFLFKVLDAVHLGLKDIALIDYQTNTNSWRAVSTQKILVFGCPEIDSPASQPYTPVEINKQLYLFAGPLREIMNDRSKKGLLWNGLKQMFSL